MREWRWVWGCCPGIGSVRLAALEALAASKQLSLAHLWRWPLHRLAEELSWPERVWNQLDRYRQHCGIHPTCDIPANALLQGDQNWPEPLNALEAAPLCLFYRGDTLLLQALQRRKAVAVVGTRSPSTHGVQMADRLGRALGRAGWPVLSGLAAGIDAAVHRGCLAVKGSPVAVLGTHLDRVYPSHHRELQSVIGRSGLLLSERFPGETPRPGHFAARNRLMVAMAAVVVIVECPERSGALISARYASELGCPVWVVPSDAGRRSARGSNALLLEQAIPLLSPDALLDVLGPGPLLAASSGSFPPQQPQISDDPLRGALEDGATLDELQRSCNRSAGSLSRVLVQLELQGLVVCEPGQRWRSV